MPAKLLKSRLHNTVEDCGTYIKKTSTNNQKIIDEVNFYRNIPDSMKHFFPKMLVPDTTYWPGTKEYDKDFYHLEKINTDSASKEYLENFNSEYHKCTKLLDSAFEFLKNRVYLPVPPYGRPSSSVKYLYYDKVKERKEEFLKSRMADQFFKNAVYHRFLVLYENLIKRYFDIIPVFLNEQDTYAWHHGDFCLSNMFMDGDQLKLIDPMGYNSKHYNLHDPLYDVAKLSHSILGNYDRILNGDFKIILKKDGSFKLKITKKDDFAKIYFHHKLKQANYNEKQIRLREASLFLSMLPLHPESMEVIAAFILQAEIILNELNYG